MIVSLPYPDGSCMATSSKEASCGLLDQILCQDGICAAQKQLPFRYHYDAALGGPQPLAWRNLVAGPGFVSGETCICGYLVRRRRREGGGKGSEPLVKGFTEKTLISTRVPHVFHTKQMSRFDSLVSVFLLPLYPKPS